MPVTDLNSAVFQNVLKFTETFVYNDCAFTCTLCEAALLNIRRNPTTVPATKIRSRVITLSRPCLCAIITGSAAHSPVCPSTPSSINYVCYTNLIKILTQSNYLRSADTQKRCLTREMGFIATVYVVLTRLGQGQQQAFK